MSRWCVVLTLLAACSFASIAYADDARRITVNGVGYAAVAPDRALVQMSVVSRDVALDAAQQGAAQVTQRVLKLMDRLGIDQTDVDTTGASVRADYRWNRQTEQQELKGYIAERQIRVRVTDLERLGAVVEGAVEAGVNQVAPPQLDSGSRRQTYRNALQAAAEDAAANARQLAQALGARLGPVISINAGSGGGQPPAPLPGMRAMSADTEAAQTYNAADLEFRADVTVVFELMD